MSPGYDLTPSARTHGRQSVVVTMNLAIFAPSLPALQLFACAFVNITVSFIEIY